ncbi:MAG: Histone deacetylase complex subunit sap18, partial [Paramarteilia canceri]
KDADLKELTSLIKEMLPDSSAKGMIYKFNKVYPDWHSPNYLMAPMGSTVIGFRGPDDLKSLNDCNFTTGDYISLAIMPKKFVPHNNQIHRNNHNDDKREENIDSDPNYKDQQRKGVQMFF